MAKRIFVVGAGTMGAGIAQLAAQKGFETWLYDLSGDQLSKAQAGINKSLTTLVEKGKIDESTHHSINARLHFVQSLDEARLADLVIEAIVENLGIKHQVFQSLEQVVSAHCILASNTSTLDVNAIAAFTQRPQDVVGLHFFSPANVMKLLEVVRGAKTGKDVMATVMGVAKKIKKTAVVSGVCDGFIGNRMIEQYSRQAGFLIEEGCTPQQVDKAVEKFGFAMGPFRMGDLAGNDIGWAIRKRRYVEKPDLKYSKTADLLCEQGRFGQKVGKGWYDYLPGKRDAIPNKEVEDMIAKHRTSLGITARKISDDEIVQRLVFSLVNEAAFILEEGIAARASDIDMVYITGYGFPIYRGGPMNYADQFGLFNVVQAMHRFAQNPHDDAQFWQPAPLLARLVADGKSFN
jgi:3-hydroxyacyl-CoA dehydrogenase